jgi:hypothetical protein
MASDVAQPERVGLLDQDTEDPTAVREASDCAVRRRIDAAGQESLETGAILIQHSECGIAGTGDRARLLEHALEHDFEV